MRADSLRTVPDLIDAFGGPTAFSKVIEKGPSTASEMKRAARIDVTYWPKIVAAAREAGIEGLEYGHLVEMHTVGRTPTEPQAAGVPQ